MWPHLLTYKETEESLDAGWQCDWLKVVDLL